jgi:pimeloyl-ACP methyl ester carboxylesterase
VKLLLVPGTGGTDFRTADGKAASYALGLLWGHVSGDDEAVTQELSCEHPWSTPPFGPSKTSLKPGVQLVPFQVLRGTAYSKVPQSYLDFPYDWRLDIRHNAARLLDRVRKLSAAGERVRLLAHSQGGLVVLAASKLCATTTEFARYVSKIALVGCPVYGTMRAAHALIDGTNFGGVAAGFLQRASRTWPAIHQMVPVYDAVAARPGWTGLTGDVWRSEPNVFPLLERARSFRSFLDSGGVASHLAGNIDLRLYFAVNRVTPFRFASPDHGLGLDGATERGDNLVPFDRTESKLRTDGLASLVRVLAGSTVNEHVTLLNDGRVASICDAFLRS